MEWSSEPGEKSKLLIKIPGTDLEVPVHIPTAKLDQNYLHYSLLCTPPWFEAVMMAFQHTIVMLGTTVMISSFLVPQMGGDHRDKALVIQTLLFTGGINTLLQTLIGTRLPTVMGASSTFIIPVMSIIKDYQEDYIFTTEHERFMHTIRGIQGALIVSSFFIIIIGYSQAWKYITRFFSPVSITSIICLGGLGKFGRGFPQVGKCMEIGLPMLILLVGIQQYLKRVGGSRNAIFEKFGVLFCIAIVWAFAALLTVSGAYNNVGEETKLNCRVDRSYLISSAPWVKIPYPFQWGAPIFKASHIFGMLGAAFASTAESTGLYFAAARSSGATPPSPHVLSRSVGLQGVGMLLDGIFGAVVGTDASAENVGLLGLTRVGSRRVVQISSAFMIFFSIFAKFGAFFASIPFPIYAAMYCVLFGYISATGISYTQYTNNNSPRNLYVLGLSLFLGISVPQYFSDSAGRRRVQTSGRWFNNIMNTMFSSPMTVVTTAGTILDNTVDTTDTEDDRGLPLWNELQKIGDKYYKLPWSGKDYFRDNNEDYNRPKPQTRIDIKEPVIEVTKQPPPEDETDSSDSDDSDETSGSSTGCQCPERTSSGRCLEGCPHVIILPEPSNEVFPDAPDIFPRNPNCVVM